MLRLSKLIVLLALLVGCGKPAIAPIRTLEPLVPDISEPVRPVVTIHADTEFSDDDKAAIAGACRIWNYQTNGIVNITVVYDLDFNDMTALQAHMTNGDNYIVSLESWMPSVVAMDGEDAKVLGWMGPAGGIHNPWGLPVHGAFVADRLNDKNRLQVFVHEFGHLLGLSHLPEVQATMYPHIVNGRKACLHKPDLEAFCRVNECGTHTMYPCE